MATGVNMTFEFCLWNQLRRITQFAIFFDCENQFGHK